MRKRRMALGLTQAEVAKRAGLTRSHYSKIERGKRDLNIDQIMNISKALDIPFDQSFFDMFRDKTEQKGVEKGDQHQAS
ncbi:helix-turn-helix transcriptional regulator [Polycladomyces sp. WAk]|uniref:Helix-turn-helix transcriptional regulator n=1 Tax=Polycladomyces zharkentensis TaxID=2807616 RepID=A0ABS2WMK7_9BACL|nr:helix-turn-helix transcriptional regulator [Polycladomyces sp. WAk]MBN2910802.1 helix-turn-helix transcriptional regulator [Polycladomyces sp. WAk]